MRFLYYLSIICSIGFVYSQELSEKQKAAVQKVVDQTTLVIANNGNQPKRMVRALMDRAEAYKKLRLYDKARTDYVALLDIRKELTDKQYDEASFNYAVMSYELGDFKKAVVWFDEVIKSESVPKRVRNEAARLRNEALKKNMDDTRKNEALINNPNVSEETKVEELIRRGKKYYNDQDYPKALVDFQNVLKNPKSEKKNKYNAHYWLCLTYAQMENYEQALKEFGELLESDYIDEESKDKVLLRRARLSFYRLKDKEEDAIVDCTTVIDRNGEGRKEALFLRARCYDWIDRNEEAIKDCSQLIDIYKLETDGKDDEKYGALIRTLRGDAYLKTGNNKEALEDYLAAKKHKKWNVMALAWQVDMFLNMASIYENQNNLLFAIDCYTAIIVMEPVPSSNRRAKAYLGRGQLYLKEGKKDFAVNDFKAVENLPDLKQRYKDKAFELLKDTTNETEK